MPGGGSIANMITTLKNNKLLLRGRKGFFKRELSYPEIREFYKSSTNPIKSQKVDEELLKSIRKKVIAHQRKENYKRVRLAIITALLLAIPLYYLFSFRISEPTNTTKSLINTNDFHHYSHGVNSEKFISGLEYLNQKKYFMAMGSFERLHAEHPNSLEIALLYAESASLLCAESKSFCPKAKSVLIELVAKYPEDDRLSKIIRNTEINYNKDIN
ncbi:MAG: hypothetical protein RIC95_12070 [Vicingaceae bacterium]